MSAEQKVVPFLMFAGRADEAMSFYLSVFDGRIVSLIRYGDRPASVAGLVMHAVFELKDLRLMASDSNVEQPFTFTPALSLYVACDSGEEIDELFGKLAQEGRVLMPLAAYPFSARFGWVEDRFGVSWQLGLGPVRG